MNLTQQLRGLTTIIETQSPGTQGTGFFYQLLDDTKNDDPHWAKINGSYLVSNRHVLLPTINGIETIPGSFRYHWRIPDASGNLRWLPVELSRDEFLAKAKFHVDPNVDVALISLYEDGDSVAEPSLRTPMPEWSVTNTSVAGRQKITVDTSDEILVLGYPRGFYDEKQLFPIVKSGIVASAWGANFNGHPHFLIDTKLYPGSSGSVVITRPRDFVIENNKFLFPQDGIKKFAFLGVFSGEPFLEASPVQLEGMTITPQHKFDVGIVWYADLVREIAEAGVRYSASTP